MFHSNVINRCFQEILKKKKIIYKFLLYFHWSRTKICIIKYGIEDITCNIISQTCYKPQMIFYAFKVKLRKYW